MITIIREGQIFSPEPLSKKDVLILDKKIGAVTPPGQIRIEGTNVNEVSASGKYILPGFIDSHVHALGGGGEGGPSTRAPEITIEDIISSGVTTIIGCLGTDGTTRHMESLLAKARGLEEEGITTYIFTGSYEIPVVTITGKVRSDLVIIDKVVGAGEIAISDHRSSQPTFDEFARLAAECRVGGMLGGKAGILHCHLGDGARRLEMFFRLINETEIPPTQIIPTHCNRNLELLNEAIEFTHQGGYIDLTANLSPEPNADEGLSIAESIKHCLKKNVPLTRISVSSDANGSLPVFDKKGRLTGLTVASQKSLLNNFHYLLKNKILRIEEAIRIFSTNAADFYKFNQKGEIKTGKDADIIFLDENYSLTDLFSKGRRMMANGKLLAKGIFS